MMFNSTASYEKRSVINGNGKADTTTEEIESHNIFSKLLKYGLLLCSFLVIILKIYYSNRDYIQNKIFSRKLIRLDWIQDGSPYFTYTWKTVSYGEPYLVPFLFGLGVTLFTWGMVYLDSRIPGENPPSPFSKPRFRRRQSFSHPVYVGYLMAVLSGILTFFVMLFTSA